MSRIRRKIDKALYHEQSKTLALVEDTITDIENGQVGAIDSLHTLRTILEGHLVETAEALGLVAESRLITKEGIINLASSPTKWKPGYSTRAIN